MLWWKLRKMASSDAATRRNSAVALGVTRDRRAIGPLVVALGDENAEVRKAAGEALSRIDPRWPEAPAATAAAVDLTPLLATGDFDRRRAVASALGAIGDRRALDALIAARMDTPSAVRLGQPTPGYYPVQREAANAIARIEGRAAVELLLEVTRRTPRDWAAVRAAAAALGELGDRLAVKPLVQVLSEDPPPNTRDEIALALVHLDDPGAAVPLAGTLLHWPLAAVAAALEKWADPATVAPLSDAAAAGSRQAVAVLTKLDPDAACRALPCLKGADRIAAAVALIHAGRVEVLPVALDGLRHLDEHKDTLASCQAALPELASFFERHASESADAVLREASDLPSVAISGIEEGCGYYGGGNRYETKVDTSRIRQLARQELIRRDPVASACTAGEWETVIGLGEAAFPALVWLLTISEKTQRPKIVRVIGRIGGPQALQPLIEALRDEDAAVRAAAAHALARLREPSTADALVVALQDRHKDVRLAAARALPALGPSAIPSLKPALRNKDHAIRRAAMEVLAQFIDPAGSELLAQGLRDPDAGVRKLSCEALAAMGEPAIPALQTVLHASNWAAVAAASELLARLGWDPSGPEDRDRFAIGRRQFQQASSDALLALTAEPQYRDAIALELGRRREPRALERLLARLDGACSVAEVEALGLMADTRAIEPLIALLRQNRDNRTGEEAAEALGKIGDIRAVDALIAAIDSKAVGRAMGSLIKLLETKAADFSEPQLRTVAGRVTITIGTGQMICATGVEESRSVECSPRLSQLARQELLRRGLEG